jgi:sulfate adenylyltransferase large subunit
MSGSARKPAFSIDDFLAQERGKDLLRFSTAGSVDDGKSTLIGRLLFDTQSVYDDQLRSIEGKGTTPRGQTDFALLTDGLRAEREQGITIDVAYRYFSTARRKFIIADTPGHEQYTRNMATGASTASAAVVLLDARKGVLRQSRRHAYIASLLGVRHILVAVNKMDLVAYDDAVFHQIANEFGAVLAQIGEDTGNAAEAVFVPVAALVGDNIVRRSEAMPWYEGASLLEALEAIPASSERRSSAFRFPVQQVVRPNAKFRGFAGQIVSGTIRTGDSVTVLPSGRSAEITRIATYDGDLLEAYAPLSVTLALSRELDISRGDLLVASDAPATVAHRCRAALVWMDPRPLELRRRYLLKHASQTVPAVISRLDSQTNLDMLTHEPANSLAMNDIGVVVLQLVRPIALDRYAEHRNTGAFILIDPDTNGTIAAGMVLDIPSDEVWGNKPTPTVSGPVSDTERRARWGHCGGILEISGASAAINLLERHLFATGLVTVRCDDDAQAQWAARNGILALMIEGTDSDLLIARAGDHAITVATNDPGELTATVRRLLVSAGLVDEPK